MSVIDNVTELQGFLQTLMKPQEAVNALNVINPIDDTTGHDLQLKLTLKYQDQLVYILVQNLSGVIQAVAALSEMDNNNSKTFEMALGGLRIAHEKLKGSIGERLRLLPFEIEPSAWGTATSLLERTYLLETIANHLYAHVYWLEELVVEMDRTLREAEEARIIRHSSNSGRVDDPM